MTFAFDNETLITDTLDVLINHNQKQTVNRIKENCDIYATKIKMQIFFIHLFFFVIKRTEKSDKKQLKQFVCHFMNSFYLVLKTTRRIERKKKGKCKKDENRQSRAKRVRQNSLDSDKSAN